MNGLYFSMVCVASGNPFVLLPRFNARDYIAALRTHRCPNLSGIPSMFAMILRERDLLIGSDFSFVRSITMGSAPLSERLLTEVKSLFPNAVITNAFGATEAGPYIFGLHPKGIPTPPLSIGYPASGVDIKLMDATDENSGVLYIRSPGLMGGYLNLPNESALRLQDGWYATGDIVRRDQDGFFFYVGRADDMFNCGGENVYPGEVEKLLESHPDVAQAAVVAVDDAVKGQVPFAFVVRKSGTDVTSDALKIYALKLGPAHSHPRFVVFLDEMPVAPSHKYDRKALSARAQELARVSGRR
jgi:acyl-CoA synthetase (AMP-forming)/AMP-acid ligase II